MRFHALLLRLLLCLALVANGTSAVHAGVGMAVDGGSEHAAAADESAPPCHDDMAAMADADGATADHSGMSSPPSMEGDCCPAGGCLCSCVWSAPTLLGVHGVALATLPASVPVAFLAGSHASPTLHHLIRPPIG